MTEQKILQSISKSLKDKLNKNGFTNGLFRIEYNNFRGSGLQETEKPIPFASENGTTLVSVTNY